MANEKEKDKNGPFLDRLLKLQYDEWLQDWALIRQDKNTMAHSLEYRLPFLDHRLIELAFTMPAHLKINGKTDKFIERRLADKVFPPHIARRAKIPFYLPVEYFLDKPQFKNLVADTPQRGRREKARLLRSEEGHRAHRGDAPHARVRLTASRSCRSLVLELWHRVFVDKSIRFD